MPHSSSSLKRAAPPVRVAHRGTPREINRQILLNLVRAWQPVSRADLARLMGTRRGAISLIVNDLIAEGVLFEGAKGETARGRKPQFLYIDSRNRSMIAVDVRPTRTSLMVTDLLTEPVVGVSTFPTDRDPVKFVRALAPRIRRVLDEHKELGRCEGIGIGVPGMVDATGTCIAFAPRLGWRDVPLRDLIAKETGLPVHIENSGRACAIAQAWGVRREAGRSSDFVFLVGLRRARCRFRRSMARSCAAAQRRRRVRAYAARHRWPGLRLRRQRLLGSLRLEPGDTVTLLRPRTVAAHADPRGDRLIHRRRPRRAGPRRRRQGACSADRRPHATSDSASPPWSMPVDPARISSAAKSLRRGICSSRRSRRARHARAGARRTRIEITPVPSPDHPRLRGAAALVTAPIFAAPRVG